MAELIDRQALLEKIWEQGHEHPNAYHLTNYATLVVREAPTIDAVPVVRCKDCKHHDGKHYCFYNDDYMESNDFCSKGVREDG